MLGFNKKGDDKQDEQLVNFIDACGFMETYSIELKSGLAVVLFALFSLFGFIPNWMARLVLCVLIARLIFEIVCLFTVDKQYDIVSSKLKYPLVVNKIDISQEDEFANIGNETPKIPGIDFVYEVKTKTEDIFSMAFQVDEKNYKILTSVKCSDIGKNQKKKVESDILLKSFDGLKKDYIYSNNCLVVNVLRLKREAQDLEIVNIEDIDETLIITECIYYPYIK